MDDWSARHLGDTIRATVEDILSKPGGLGTRILREEGIRELVDGFVRGNPVSAALGSLLTAEVWREQVQRTCEEAGRGQ